MGHFVDEFDTISAGPRWKFRVLIQQRGERGQWFTNRCIGTFMTREEADRHAQSDLAQRHIMGAAGTRIVVRARGQKGVL